MYRIFKNGICISGFVELIYPSDPKHAYMEMEKRFQKHWYSAAARHAYTLRSKDYIIDMGKPIEQSVTVIPDEVKAPTDETDWTDKEEFYDPLDHPDREHHIPCDDSPFDHFGE